MRSFDYSRLSEKCWDNETVMLCSKIHEYRGRQELFLNQKPAMLIRLAETAKTQSIEASNRIEGIETTPVRMKKLFEEKTIPRNTDEKAILGYRDVLNTVNESFDCIEMNPNYILQLHRDLLSHTGFLFAGHFKSVQNNIKETLADGTSVIRFEPPAPFETPDAVDSLCASLKMAFEENVIDPLLLIPIFISDFMCIHPFNDGNGRMGRLLTLILLYKCGYMVGRYVSVENQIDKTKEDYYDALAMINDGWREGNNDPDAFVKYMLKVILSCYEEFEERIMLAEETGVKSSVYDMVRVFVDNSPEGFSVGELMENCPGVGRTSAFNALKKLLEEGYIEKYGERQKAVYTKKES